MFNYHIGRFTEQYDQYGNSKEYSQAPDDGYINVRKMLSK